MDLDEVIETYKHKATEDPKDAALFILKEMQDGESAHVLSRRYLALVVIGKGDIAGYDPIADRLYDIDPHNDQLDFEPELGSLVLFERKGKKGGIAANGLQELGLAPFVQKLKVVGKSELEMDAHMYDPKQLRGGERINQFYSDQVMQAKSLQLESKKYGKN